MFSPMDVEVGLVVQTNPKVAPTTGNLLILDYIPGSMMTVTSAQIESQTLKPNRASGGMRRGLKEVTGSFKMCLHRDEAVSLIFASILGNTWIEEGEAGEGGDTLRPGKKKIAFMIVQTLTDDEGNVVRDEFLGCEVTKIDFSAENSTGIDLTVTFVGIDAKTDLVGASPLTRVEASDELELIGDDLKNMKVTDVTVSDWTKLDFSIEQARDAKPIIGSNVAVGTAASAPRKVTGAVSFYRPSGVAPGFTGAGQGLSFDLLDAYGISMPSVFFVEPQHSYGSSAVESTATFSAGYNKVAATDIVIIRP